METNTFTGMRVLNVLFRHGRSAVPTAAAKPGSQTQPTAGTSSKGEPTAKGQGSSLLEEIKQLFK